MIIPPSILTYVKTKKTLNKLIPNLNLNLKTFNLKLKEYSPSSHNLSQSQPGDPKTHNLQDSQEFVFCLGMKERKEWSQCGFRLADP